MLSSTKPRLAGKNFTILLLTFLLNVTGFPQAPDTLWTKSFGDTIPRCYMAGLSVQQTTDGGFIIAGYKQPITGGGYKIYLVKTNSEGDTMWTFSFPNYAVGYSVQQTTDQGFILTGICNNDLILLKTNLNGSLLWYRLFDSGGQELGNSVYQTYDGGFIITGSRYDSGGNFDLWLLKTNSSGDSIWTKSFGGTGYDWGYSVQQTLDGGYIIAGKTNSFGWLIKTDSNGNIVWSRLLGEGSANSVQQNPDGCYIVTGGSGGHVWLVKTNEIGDTLWTKKFGVGVGNSVKRTTDNGFIIAGNLVTNLDNFGIIKTDSVGNFIWQIILSNGKNSCAYSIDLATDGGYIISGYKGANIPISGDYYQLIWLVKLKSEPILSLIYPNGGEYWINGTTEAIAWSSENLDDVKIELSIDNGVSWNAIVDSTPSTGLYSWTVSSPVFSDECLIRLSEFSNPDFYDVSDSVFTIDIIPRNIDVLIPNGGENWIIGTNEAIAWTNENIDSVKIELSLDNGNTWNTIVDSLASSGIYTWTVNSPTSSDECLIRISDLSFPDYYDESDSVFTIDFPQSIELLPDKGIPDKFTLFQNFPNPFNPTTTIQFGVSTSCFVELKLYDILGKEVSTLISEDKNVGYYSYKLNGDVLPSGIYFYRIKAGNFVATKKMLLLK